jgi:hypothetical protein
VAMGGRSSDRVPNNHRQDDESSIPDAFKWLEDVNDSRLEGYARASTVRRIQGSDPQGRRIFEVGHYARQVFESRHGSKPEW